MNVKALSYTLTNNLNFSFPIMNKKMGTWKKVIKTLTLAPTNKRKGIPKKYKELWNKIRYPIRSKTYNSEEKYIKT